jgi:hypothetical protein
MTASPRPETALPSPRDDRLESLEGRIRAAETKLALIRGRQAAVREWERSRRPIRIGFFVAIPIVLSIEAVHLYMTLDLTQGGGRAPWLMLLATAFVIAISLWYYRQAKRQRDGALRGFARAARFAGELEARIAALRRERESLRSETDFEV